MDHSDKVRELDATLSPHYRDRLRRTIRRHACAYAYFSICKHRWGDEFLPAADALEVVSNMVMSLCADVYRGITRGTQMWRHRHIGSEAWMNTDVVRLAPEMLVAARDCIFEEVLLRQVGENQARSYADGGDVLQKLPLDLFQRCADDIHSERISQPLTDLLYAMFGSLPDHFTTDHLVTVGVSVSIDVEPAAMLEIPDDVQQLFRSVLRSAITPEELADQLAERMKKAKAQIGQPRPKSSLHGRFGSLLVTAATEWPQFERLIAEHFEGLPTCSVSTLQFSPARDSGDSCRY